MSARPLRWGIVSTGRICTKFCQDLLADPQSRGSSDVAHIITAVGSRTLETAQTFVNHFRTASDLDPWAWGVRNGRLEDCQAYGSYDELHADPNVDIVYIGTPHTFHHRNAKDALLAGKHVLCEKPFTVDLAEMDELFALARRKNLFLMEAIWTRFHPLAYAVQDAVFSGKLGRPKRFAADFSMEWYPDMKDTSQRMLDPAVGGGSLLDQGPYPSVWAMLLVHQHPMNRDKNPQVLNFHQTVYQRTGVDLNTRWLVEWSGFLQGTLTTDMDCAGLREHSVVLQCEEGDLAIAYPPSRPETFYIIPRPDRQIGGIKEKTTHHHPIPPGVNGMGYEADEVGRCIRDGKLESTRMPWDESRVVQGWFDHIRTNGPSLTRDLKGSASSGVVIIPS